MKKRTLYIILGLACIIIFFLLTKKEKKIDNISSHNFYPYTNKGELIEHSYFSLNYNEDTEQPNWVFYKLSPDMLNSDFKRCDCFKEDLKIKSQSSHPSDYKYSGYDKGHLAPSAIMRFNDVANKESFLMSNISPQLPSFNRGIWKKIETQIRDVAKTKDSIHIITGPVFKSDSIKFIGENKVAIPEYFFKVLLVYDHKSIEPHAFLLPHKKLIKDISSFRTNIDEVEKITGFDFFTFLSNDHENKIENIILKSF